MTSKHPKYLEVIISKQDDGYKAEAPLFPKCIGNGKTSKDALEMLSQQISAHLGIQIESYLKTLFTSEEYQEIYIDPDQKQHCEQRFFNLEKTQSHLFTNIHLKLKGLPEDLIKENTPPNNDIRKLLHAFKPPTTGGGSAQVLKQEPQIPLDQDQFLFGIQLCLN